jgi:transcriptional regulator with PAS, ATPase and Fis domain
MQRVREGIAKLARVNSHVLITGETGTGKELAAELIHRMSPRGHRPFVCLNCAAIPDTLLESELFGYERGAFTGAFGSQRGKLEEAEDGTIFFDEVGDMSMAAQAKVLRTIENREVSRLGSHGLRVIRCRVVAATNQDLERCVVEGQFRKDLYFRLNVARLQLPPLRDRMEDIPELCVRFIRQFNQEMGAAVERLSDEVLRDFTNYHWPGNVRELKNTVEATFIVAQSGTITRDMLPPLFRLGAGSSGLAGERDQLLATLLETNGNKSRAAEKLNFSRMTLYRKLARHRIGGKETPSAGTA